MSMLIHDIIPLGIGNKDKDDKKDEFVRQNLEGPSEQNPANPKNTDGTCQS